MKVNRCNFVILFMVTLLFGACSSYFELEGTWVGYADGKSPADWILTIKGDYYNLVREDSTTWYRGQIKLNNNCLLKKIDFEISDTSVQAHYGKTLLGIYKLEAETLTIVTGEPGDQLRPRSFDEYEKAVVFIFARS
ncbi:MAG: hypothetical protein PVI06_04705 [Desulfobacterales bacterium]